MARSVMLALRSRRCVQLVRIFIGVCLVAVFYSQLRILFRQKSHDLPPELNTNELARKAMLDGQVNQKKAKIAPTGMRLNSSIWRKVDHGYPDLADRNKLEKEAMAKREGYPRGPVEEIQDLVDDAYERVDTPEFKKKLADINQDMNRYTSGDKYNKSDQVVTVVLMPHSHNDPGWLWTFDTYHTVRTAGMFNNLVMFLSTVNSDMPFHWSESVNLLKWYQTATDSDKKVVKSAITSKRILMDHGSWSMPDEASTSIYSLVENLILGHTWVNNEFDVKPEYSWANDPFGHSATIPYLLKQCGLKAIVINRIDMLLKKELREQQKLEFYWRPGTRIDKEDDSEDMFTHILPHGLYITKESFGPDLNFAKTFDFSPPEMRYSPLVDYNTGEVSIDKETLEVRARLLSQQIHHRSAYFKHNVILSPIGDDFRYISYNEFTGVDKNWNFLKDYYEKNPQHKVKLQFGTLADYFRLIDEHVKANQYPVLSGDFFPYSDNSDMRRIDLPPSDNAPTYWTGYFTTRPFLKIGVRRLEILLRQTEILYSMYKLNLGASMSSPALPTNDLSKGRETLSWLLHHDAITGTSPVQTIADFMTHLDAATANLEKFSAQVAHSLGSKASNIQTEETTHGLVLDTSPHVLVRDAELLGKEAHRLMVIETDSQQVFTLFNSLVHPVTTVAHIKLKVAKGQTSFSLSTSGQPVTCQINPIVDTHYQVVDEYVELSFVASIPSLGRQSYKLTPGGEGSCELSTVRIYGSPDTPVQDIKQGLGKFTLETKDITDEPVQLSTELNRMSISARNGTLLSMKVAGKDEMMVTNQIFGLYNMDEINRHLENGIYLFTTANEGTTLEYDIKNTPPPLIITGRVETVVLTTLPFVTQCLRINSIEPSVAVTQLVTLTTKRGDLFTRIRSNVKSEDMFYTDSNSFTMTERRNSYPDRSIASNYYPITSSTFIDDDSHRLTLLTAQPLGATSLHSGELEIMLERRHLSHDHAGVSDPMDDNRPVVMQFRLLAELVDKPETPAVTALSLHHYLKNSYPVHAFLADFPSSMDSFYLPCDHHLVNFRSLDTLPYGEALPDDRSSLALVLQRFAVVEGKSDLEDKICHKEDKVTWKLPTGYLLEKTSLSLLHTYEKITEISLDKPNTIQTYRISKH